MARAKNKTVSSATTRTTVSPLLLDNIRNEEVKEKTIFGQKLRLGRADRNAEIFFMTQSHILACETAKQTGWEIAAIEGGAFVNVLPDGRAVDLSGVYDGPEKDWGREFIADNFAGAEVTRNVSPATVLKHSPRLSEYISRSKIKKIAKSYVEAVLKFTEYPGTARQYNATYAYKPGLKENNYPFSLEKQTLWGSLTHAMS